MAGIAGACGGGCIDRACAWAAGDGAWGDGGDRRLLSLRLSLCGLGHLRHLSDRGHWRRLRHHLGGRLHLRGGLHRGHPGHLRDVGHLGDRGHGLPLRRAGAGTRAGLLLRHHRGGRSRGGDQARHPGGRAGAGPGQVWAGGRLGIAAACAASGMPTPFVSLIRRSTAAVPEL